MNSGVPNLITRTRKAKGSRTQFRRCKHTAAVATDQEKVVSNLDVSGAVVNPSFRSTPWEAESRKDSGRRSARIVFVSESNVCRSALAEGFMTQLLKGSELRHEVEIASRATRDYNIGEPPEPSAVLAAADLGVELDANFAARRFDYEGDTVHYDMILVMDKFTAADVMREISVYDTINKHGKYTQKVRRLGEFHPTLANAQESDGQDIDDPLYGNEGGEKEEDAVRRAALVIREACRGLLAFLQQLREQSSSAPLHELLKEEVQSMEGMDWLVPPMLQQR